MSEERKNKVLGVANLFMSTPMTLNELTKRVGITEGEALQYFNKDLKIIDYQTYLSVQKILDFLKNYKIVKVN